MGLIKSKKELHSKMQSDYWKRKWQSIWRQQQRQKEIAKTEESTANWVAKAETDMANKMTKAAASVAKDCLLAVCTVRGMWPMIGQLNWWVEFD